MKFIIDMLKDAGVHNSKSAASPLRSSIKLDPIELFEELEKYRRVIGRLLYLNFTRPDIAYATQQLSQYMQAPTKAQFLAAIHVRGI